MNRPTLLAATFLRDLAYNFIIENDLKYPPNIISVAAKTCSLVTYKYLEKYYIGDLQRPYPEDGILTADYLKKKHGVAAIKWIGDDDYLIAFDGTAPYDLLHWSITHELAHLYLKHTGAYEVLHSATEDRSMRIMEDAAEILTLYILCPEYLIKQLELDDADQIANKFNVPTDKLLKYAEYLYITYNFPNSASNNWILNKKVINHFKSYIDQYNNFDLEISDEFYIAI